MNDQNFQADNHYVSRFYLKPWTSSGKVWVYRLLVSNPNVPHWESKSPSSVASLRHLYTRTDSGEATDEVERWFSREFETPAASAVRKAVSDEVLTPDDWYVLIRFLAAQDLRTPRSYFESKARLEKTLPSIIKETVEWSVQSVTDAAKRGETVAPASSRNASGFPMRVIPDRKAGQIKVEVLNGRELWMLQMKRSLESTAKLLHKHHWMILAPPSGMKWLTSDNPVIHLNFRSFKDYNLQRGWANPNANIMLPLGPQHLLFTQVGTQALPQMTEEQASLIRRVTAENAFRLIFADALDAEVPEFRVRKENAEEFQAERQYWASWHDNQSEAERDFRGAA